MLTKRQTVILRMLLSYGLSNLDDIRRAFTPPDGEEVLDYNGEKVALIAEDEIAELMKLFQG
jgi:hypothetical protein